MAVPSQAMPAPIDIGDIFMSGFADSVNPCALASVIWLIVVLAFAGRTRQQVFSIGTQFVIAYFIGSFVITMGMLDFIAAFFNIHFYLKTLQLCIAVPAILLGCACIHDWWRCLQGQGAGGQLLRYPAIVFNENVLNDATTDSGWKSFRQGIVLYVWVWGVFVALLASVWPPNYIITQLQSGLFLQGERFISIVLVLAYQTLYSLPMATVFAVILYAVNSPKTVRSWQGSIGAVKMFMAGMLIGWGLSLIYLFW